MSVTKIAGVYNLLIIFLNQDYTAMAGGGVITIRTENTEMKAQTEIPLPADSVLGEGTTFTIFLQASDKKIQCSDENVNIKHTGRGRILVMDDDVSILFFSCSF